MRGGRINSGYTIVEVMIVLAVSGLILFIAVGFTSGRQAKTAFYTSVANMNSQINSVIDEVRSGQYSDTNFKCSKNISTGNIDIASSGSQGTNLDCIFAGKLFWFAQGTSNYKVYSVAGLNQSTGATDAVYLTNLKPTAIIASGPSPAVDLTYSAQIQQNIRNYSDSVITAGFIQSGDSSRVILGKVSGAINVGSPTSLIPTDKVVLCLSDGTRFASIVIKNNPMQSNYSIKTNLANCKSG